MAAGGQTLVRFQNNFLQQNNLILQCLTYTFNILNTVRVRVPVNVQGKGYCNVQTVGRVQALVR